MQESTVFLSTVDRSSLEQNQNVSPPFSMLTPNTNIVVPMHSNSSIGEEYIPHNLSGTNETPDGKFSDDDSDSVAKSRSSSRGKWTQEEDDILRNAVLTHGGRNWKKISDYLEGRTDVQCLHRWQKVLRPGLVKGPWTTEEDESVVELVAKHGVKSWSFIARQLKGRLGKQCRERWYNHLNPSISKTPWTEEEDRIIIDCHAKHGNKWAVIATYLPGRTDNAIKNRWNSTLQRLLKQSNDGTLRSKKNKGSPSRKDCSSLDIDGKSSTRSIDGGSYCDSVGSDDYSNNNGSGMGDVMGIAMSAESMNMTPLTPEHRSRLHHTPQRNGIDSSYLDRIREGSGGGGGSSGHWSSRERGMGMGMDIEGGLGRGERDRERALREMRIKLRMRNKDKGSSDSKVFRGQGQDSIHDVDDEYDESMYRSSMMSVIPIEVVSSNILASPSILRRPPLKRRSSQTLLADNTPASACASASASGRKSSEDPTNHHMKRVRRAADQSSPVPVPGPVPSPGVGLSPGVAGVFPTPSPCPCPRTPAGSLHELSLPLLRHVTAPVKASAQSQSQSSSPPQPLSSSNRNMGSKSVGGNGNNHGSSNSNSNDHDNGSGVGIAADRRENVNSHNDTKRKISSRHDRLTSTSTTGKGGRNYQNNHGRSHLLDDDTENDIDTDGGINMGMGMGSTSTETAGEDGELGHGHGHGHGHGRGLTTVMMMNVNVNMDDVKRHGHGHGHGSSPVASVSEAPISPSALNKELEDEIEIGGGVEGRSRR